MHIELQEKGIHVHIGIDEKEFPGLGTQTLYEEARGTLSRIREARTGSKVETVEVSGQYL